MNLHRVVGTALLCALPFGLAACGSDSGRIEEGLTARFKAQPLGTPGAAIAKHGSPGAELLRFRRNDGMLIELELGAIALVPVALEPCATAAAWLDRLSPLGSAHAHAGHGGVEAPEGVLNLADPEAAGFSLGQLAVTPGEYCGVRFRIEPALAAKHAGHGGQGPSAAGGVQISACYYEQTRTMTDAEVAAVGEDDPHDCFEVKAESVAREFVKPLAQPLVLDAARREAEITVTVRHETWFDELTLSPGLGNNATAVQALLANLERSIDVLGPSEQPVTLVWAPEVNGEPARCDAVYQVGNGELRDYQLRDFRFYVTNAEVQGPAQGRIRWLPRADGAVYQDAELSVLLAGFANGCAGTVEDRRFATTFHGVAPAGVIDRLAFETGLPFAANHSNVATAPAPLNVTAMNWSWLTGRKFIRVDGRSRLGEGDTPANFHLHLGSTGCENGGAGNSAAPTAECRHPNRMAVTLDWPAGQNHLRISADVGRVFAASDVANNTPQTQPGCMSANTDPDCVPVMARLGLPFSHNGTVHPAGEQVFFRVAH